MLLHCFSYPSNCSPLFQPYRRRSRCNLLHLTLAHCVIISRESGEKEPTAVKVTKCKNFRRPRRNFSRVSSSRLHSCSRIYRIISHIRNNLVYIESYFTLKRRGSCFVFHPRGRLFGRLRSIYCSVPLSTIECCSLD